MEGLLAFFHFVWGIRAELVQLTGEHILISLTAVILGASVAIPFGVFIARYPRTGAPLIDLTSVLYTIPSLALLGFLIPFTGLGWSPAIIALFIYSLLPLLRNTYIGISEVDYFMKEAATGMGATPSQVFWRVELPMALPSIMAGLRTVTVLTVGIATMGSLVGAGGLGVFVFRGIHMIDTNLLLAGTLPIAIMAVTLDNTLHAAEQTLKQRMGMQERKNL